MDPSTLSAEVGLLSKASGLTDHIEYWRQYKNKSIDIRDRSLRLTEDNDQYIEDILITRGTVEEILGRPAGFLLTDVDELHTRRNLIRSHSNQGASDTVVTSDTTRQLRHTEEKIVAFREIGELEMTEISEDANTEIRDI